MNIEKLLCTRHTGKMKGMVSLSTSPRLNPWCKSRAERGHGVCAHCYAQRSLKRYPQLVDKLERNTQILTGRLIAKEDLPKLNVSLFRLESFGDLVNEIQVQNYFNLCNANKQTKFALWTKNPWLIARVLEYQRKPKNLQIVYSMVALNSVARYEDVHEQFPFVDRIFTVFDKEHAKNVEINCGKKKCLECGLCYRNSKVKEIKEVLK